VIPSLPFSASQNTSTAHTSASDPRSACTGTVTVLGHTVWYVFTADENITITADTFGSDYDTALSVLTLSGNTFTEVACNDDFGNPQSQVSFSASAGTTYYFMIGVCCDATDPGGNLVFTVSGS
jgi:hypothetical protein